MPLPCKHFSLFKITSRWQTTHESSAQLCSVPLPVCLPCKSSSSSSFLISRWLQIILIPVDPSSQTSFCPYKADHRAKRQYITRSVNATKALYIFLTKNDISIQISCGRSISTLSLIAEVSHWSTSFCLIGIVFDHILHKKISIPEYF